jgi:hypothetical protein
MRSWVFRPGVGLVGHVVNMSIQSRTATSSFSVFGEKLSSRRTFAS